MCINHYEYAKGPSRITHTSPSEQPIDSMVEDINYDTTVIRQPETEELGWRDYLSSVVTIAKRWEERTEWNPEVTTSTTTIFTPGIDNTKAALEIKGVADNLLGATGAVLGGTGALLSNPGAFALGVSSGDQAGRNLGAVMWNVIDSTWWRSGSLANDYNRGQDPGPKGWRSYSGL